MAPGSDESSKRGILRALLGLPLFFKLLIANALIVFVAAVASASAAHRAVASVSSSSHLPVIFAIGGLALLASLIVNALVIRAALSPLDKLGEAAHRVQSGDLDARAKSSPLADRTLEELTRTFNTMLDRIAEHRKRLREVASRALDAAEAERLRISRDLHDGVAQSLAGTLLQLRVARDARDPTTQQKHLDAIATALVAATEDLRAIALGLRPPALDMLGLQAALESYTRTIAGSTGLRVALEAHNIDRLLTRESELVLYRLIQEAVANVARHASVDSAVVKVQRENGSIVATVADAGRGFSMNDAIIRNGAIGLLGMRERAAYVGGSVQFESVPGKGTRVRIEIPTQINGTHV